MPVSVEQEFARELKALRILVEQTQGGVLAFSLFSDVNTREQASRWLAQQSVMAVRTVRLSKNFTEVEEAIRSEPEVPRRCFLFFDIEAAFPNILGYVNLRRERLLQYGHALVFWVREEGMRRIAEGAPDLWAWRSQVFDFRTADTFEELRSVPSDSITAHYSPDQLTRQLRALEESGSTDLVSLLAMGRRLFAVGRYLEASDTLEKAVESAQLRSDERALADALLALGHSRLQQGLLDQARPLYAEGLNIAERLRLAEQTVSAMRGLSTVAGRNGDLETAYHFAMSAMMTAKASNDPSSLADAYDVLGDVLFKRKQLKEAEGAYVQAAAYQERLSYFREVILPSPGCFYSTSRWELLRKQKPSCAG